MTATGIKHVKKKKKKMKKKKELGKKAGRNKKEERTPCKEPTAYGVVFLLLLVFVCPSDRV